MEVVRVKNTEEGWLFEGCLLYPLGTQCPLQFKLVVDGGGTEVNTERFRSNF